MIEVERGQARLRLRAGWSDANSTAVDWRALLKTSAETWPRFVPKGRHLKSVMTRPTRYLVRYGRWRRVVSAARRCAYRGNQELDFYSRLFCPRNRQRGRLSAKRLMFGCANPPV